MEHQRDINEDRSDDEDNYERRRDDDKFRSEREDRRGRERNTFNSENANVRRDRNRDRSDGEDANDRRRRDMNRDRMRRSRSRSNEDDGNGRSNRKKKEDGRKSVRHDQSDEEAAEIRKSGKKHEINDKEDDEIRETERKEKHEGRSDEEDGEVRRRDTKGKDRRSDDEDVYKDRRRRDKNKNIGDGEDDKYTKIRDDDDIRRRDGKGDEDDSKNDGNKRSVRHDLSLEEVAETRKSGRNHEKSDDKDGEIRKMVRKGILEERSDDDDNDDIRKKRRRGKDRSDDEDDYKDKRRRDRYKNRSDDEDDKYKKRRDSRKARRGNGDHKDRRRSDQKNDKNEATENLDEGPRFQKLAEIQEGFTDVFAALVAVVNTKFPEVGELLLRRIILQLQRAYKRNDKHQLLAAVKFIAHLVNQQIVHELIALELLTLLLENPTDDSVEVAVGFVTECGSILQDLSPKGLHGIFERFRGILHEGEIDKRVQFLIEGLFALRKAKFQGHPAVRPELDLVELEDQLTHEISILDKIDPEIALDIFKADPDILENEKRYEDLKKTILGEESSEDEEGGEDSDEEDGEDSEEEDEEQMRIRDETETNLVNLRRTIYLTIMSSVDFEEAGHKLLKIKLEPGQEMELCIMLLECCSQERTYLRYYGLLGQRFCMINKVHQENFEKCFVQQYSMIHRLETNKLRNVAKFFAHLLGTDALPWHVLAYIRLTEEDTTSSSRIFIKILFQELSEHLGIRLLNERLSDPSMQADFESIFPRDNPKNTRFSINFFTSIGLGGITENLREYLKNMPRLIMQQKPASESDDSDSSSSGSESSSTDESESSSESSDSESDHKRRRRR
ncbi:hypothetical protein E3N88_12063 [Mikania micrantha]|uniref:MI domain-containing protein n=1 Tax=Mikania micrantha TaxID=192012 RepID=A0A5N6P4G2_9ASTR|nr:hypothetical protein E3N88_12063 [Mikania micrantha]